MCCEMCNKWQHIRCHDQADFIAGRSRRDWDSEEFICDTCKTRTEKQTSHQHLRGKQLEQPSRLQLQSSSANYAHLPKLHLRPSYQHPQSLYPLYPQQPYVSSQNWVMYNGNNGATGTNIKNGKSVPASNDTTPGTPKVKTNDFYAAAPGTMQPVYGHDHPYAARHQPSVPENNHSVVPMTGVPPNLQPYQSITRSVPSPSFTTAHLVQRPNPSYSSTPSAYSPEHSSHYPVSINSNLSRHVIAHGPLGGTSTQSSGINLEHALSPELSSQYSEAYKKRFEMGQENLGLRSNVMAAESAVTSSTAPTTDNLHCEALNTPIHPLPH